MKKMLFSLISLLLLSSIISACSFPLFQFFSAATPTPTATIPVASPTPTFTPTIVTPSSTPTRAYAPLCEAEQISDPITTQCKLPIGEQSSTFCNKKVPVNLVLLNPGSTFQVLDKEFSCQAAGTKNGMDMITCTGPMALSFEVLVCDPTCPAPTVPADTTACPMYYTYNGYLGCCTKELRETDPNCVILKLKTPYCVWDCGQYKKKKACMNQGFACEWNADTLKCQQRK